MASKSTILNLRLDPEDKAWLEGQVEELGLDNVSAVMRSLIRRAKRGVLEQALPPQQVHFPNEEAERRYSESQRRAEEALARKEAERQRKAAELRRQLAELEDGGEPEPDPEPDHIGDADEMIPDFEVPPDSDGGNVTEFKPLPTGFKPPGSLARPAGAANGLVADRSPAGESMKRNYHHLLPR